MYCKIAEDIARKAHKGQHRWGGEPYITHPEAVVEYIKKNQSSRIYKEETIATAWLHDVIEDCDITTKKLLDSGIPKEVVEAVTAISKKDKEDYLDYILRVKENNIARIVKIADITHNLSTLKKDQRSRIAKYKLARYILQNCQEWED